MPTVVRYMRAVSGRAIRHCLGTVVMRKASAKQILIGVESLRGPIISQHGVSPHTPCAIKEKWDTNVFQLVPHAAYSFRNRHPSWQYSPVKPPASRALRPSNSQCADSCTRTRPLRKHPLCIPTAIMLTCASHAVCF